MNDNSIYQTQKCIGPLVEELVEYIDFYDRTSLQKMRDGFLPKEIEQELLYESRLARRRFQFLTTQYLRKIRQLRNTSQLADLLKNGAQYFSQFGDQSISDLADRILSNTEVKKAIKDARFSGSAIKSLRDRAEQYQLVISVINGQFQILYPDQRRHNIVLFPPETTRSKVRLKKANTFDLLVENIGEHGRFLSTVAPERIGIQMDSEEDTDFVEGIAGGAVAALREFDLRIRSMEDLGSLPIYSGNDGGASAAVGLILFLIGVLIYALSDKVSDPGWSLFLKILGGLLTFGGALLAGATVTATRCFEDPPGSGLTRCETTPI